MRFCFAAEAALYEELFRNPLIIGASISAGYLSEGPGTLVAKKYSARERIDVVAGSGDRGADFFAKHAADIFNDRSIIIGVDLFFWDTVDLNLERSVAAMRMFAELKIRFIIGDVPELFPNYQLGAKRINAEIKKIFGPLDNFRIVPLHGLHQKLVKEKSIHVGERRLALRDFMPDGLHVGSWGSQFLADFIENNCLYRQ